MVFSSLHLYFWCQILHLYLTKSFQWISSQWHSTHARSADRTLSFSSKAEIWCFYLFYIQIHRQRNAQEFINSMYWEPILSLVLVVALEWLSFCQDYGDAGNSAVWQRGEWDAIRQAYLLLGGLSTHCMVLRQSLG